MLYKEQHYIVEDVLSEFVKIKNELLEQNFVAYVSEIIDELAKRRPEYDEELITDIIRNTRFKD